MKANGLNGEYCQNCAAILDDVQRNHRKVIVLDSQCVMVFQQSGDANLLDPLVKNWVPPAPGAGTVPSDIGDAAPAKAAPEPKHAPMAAPKPKAKAKKKK